MSPPRKTVEQYEREAVQVGECLIHDSLRVSRKIYQMRHGPLPSNVLVCHTCDNIFCIRDSHHFPGSSRDNVRDAVAKGRHSCLHNPLPSFNGPQTDEAKAKIAEASRRMWRERRSNT